MILVDTSVWIDHLRVGNEQLVVYLTEGLVYCHPFIVGELACGNLRNRDETLELMSALPSVQPGDHDEVLQFISNYSLQGRGIGWIDAHLLASAMLTDCRLWTFDKPLLKVATTLKVSL